ncbi:MAG: PAS domain S-box protein [Elusimicrobia bacterium]|nr:PAS domain S-box protein [Elusimicrobiota bacterium]MDE2313187.1 PAS domain S-box protein [Elusimicrobiota bacterium]
MKRSKHGRQSHALSTLMKSSKPAFKQLFQALLDSAGDMIWIREIKDGKILDANRAALRTLGYPRQEFIGRNIHEFYDGMDNRSCDDFAARIKKNGSALLNTVFRARSGRRIQVESRGSLIGYAGKQAVLSISRDIGQALRDERLKTFFYAAFRRSNDAMFYCDRNGVILDVNEAFTKIYGYSREEAVGKTPAILRSRHSTDELYRRMWASILEPSRGFWRGEMINLTKDRREIPLNLTITAVRDSRGDIIGYMSNAVNLSERIALQERVAQSEALASIGEMATVLAHEIRNPLGSIVMAAKQISGDSLDSNDRAMALRILSDESHRLNETLTNFLSFARPRGIKLSRGSLNAIVTETCSIIRSNPDLTKGIRIRIACDPKIKSFPMDVDQIRQVAWNIILNGVQALDGRGQITVTTGRRDSLAFFRVADTGPGIPAPTLAEIFKPFHTTKKQGTGLGLAIADRIVKSHGGRIQVKSAVGRGSTFTIFLPFAEARNEQD